MYVICGFIKRKNGEFWGVTKIVANTPKIAKQTDCFVLENYEKRMHDFGA